MDMERLVKAIMAFWELPMRADGVPNGRPTQHAGHEELTEALAEHLAAKLPVTVDELVEVFSKYNRQNSEAWCLRIRVDGSGSVRDSDDSPILHWVPDSSGKGILAAIEAAMKLEPTALDDFEELLKLCPCPFYCDKDYSKIDAMKAKIRKALEDEL